MRTGERGCGNADAGTRTDVGMRMREWGWISTRDALDMVLPATAETSTSSATDRVIQLTRARTEAEEALAFAALESKRQFDRSHKPLFLEP